MIGQVFAHRVFPADLGEIAIEAEIETGLEASCTVLGALNTIAAEGFVLNASSFTIADCHLAPMIAYFIQAPEGVAALEAQPARQSWWGIVSKRESIKETDPGSPSPLQTPDTR